jgi:arginyl-tRNA synthetase
LTGAAGGSGTIAPIPQGDSLFPDALHDAVRTALDAAADAGGLPALGELPFEVERPRDRSHGDWATNVALVAAKPAQRPPREVAAAVLEHLPDVPHLSGAEIAGPGFINFTLDASWLGEVLRQAASGPEHGRVEVGAGDKVQVEFVSVNPNGPIHVGHGRGAVLGDALCNLLDYAGYSTEREYYFNDAGVQMDRYAASLHARYLQALGQDAELPDDGYHGEYLVEWGQELVDEVDDACVDDPGAIHEWGLQRAIRDIRETLELAGVRFDVWFSERTLHDRQDVARTLDVLNRRGYTYESEGAVWFRTTDFGDVKDRVLVKTDGAFTYITPDIAYHRDKFERGFDIVINIWGADHHGYVPRMKAGVEAMGYDPERLEIVITQLVNVSRGGEPVRMSTRAGEFITFREVIEEVGIDATRYYLLAVSPDTTVNFDLEVAKRQSMDNPVYYLQYAYARVRSLERFATEAGVTRAPLDEADLSLLTDEAEIALLQEIDRLSEVVIEAAARRAPHRVVGYGYELAGAFHKFYTDCRVVTDDAALTQARLWLVEAAKNALLAVLEILGISAPERM